MKGNSSISLLCFLAGISSLVWNSWTQGFPLLSKDEYAQGQSCVSFIFHALNSHQFHWMLTLLANGSIRSASRNLLCWGWRRFLSHFHVLSVILLLQNEDIGSTRSCHFDFVVLHNTFVLAISAGDCMGCRAIRRIARALGSVCLDHWVLIALRHEQISPKKINQIIFSLLFFFLFSLSLAFFLLPLLLLSPFCFFPFPFSFSFLFPSLSPFSFSHSASLSPPFLSPSPFLSPFPSHPFLISSPLSTKISFNLPFQIFRQLWPQTGACIPNERGVYPWERSILTVFLANFYYQERWMPPDA